MRKLLATLFLVLIGAALLMMVSEMPAFGDPSNPSNNILSERFIKKTLDDTNILNVVTAIITDYRGYDTLGEATVLFAGIVAVISVLEAHVNADKVRDVSKDE